MITFMRLARVVLLLVLAVITLSLVIAVAKPDTGALEKGVLVVLIAGCVFVAARITTWETQLEERVRGT